MNLLHKTGAGLLLAVAGLTAAGEVLARCHVETQLAWMSNQVRTLSCQNTAMADFWLNIKPSTSYQHARVNLTGGTYAQMFGLTQSGAQVAGCSVDDLTANNVPVYLNWNGFENPSCSQAYLALVAAGTSN